MINYTDEQTIKLVSDYTNALASGMPSHEIVDILAETFDKPKRSIIGKLSKEGVYVKKVYKTKAGGLPTTKKEMIYNLSDLIGADAERLQGLEKAPKMDLTYLIEVLKRKDCDHTCLTEGCDCA